MSCVLELVLNWQVRLTGICFSLAPVLRGEGETNASPGPLPRGAGIYRPPRCDLPRPSHQSVVASEDVSAPARVPTAHQMAGLMVLLMLWTEPSQKRKLTP